MTRSDMHFRKKKKKTIETQALCFSTAIYLRFTWNYDWGIDRKESWFFLYIDWGSFRVKLWTTNRDISNELKLKKLTPK